MRRPGALLQFHLLVGRVLGSAERSCGLGRCWYGVAFDGRAAGSFDGAEPGGDAGFAGGDGFAVAAAVGAFGQALAELLDFADVGLSLVGVGGDGEDGGVGGADVQDQADRVAVGIAIGQGDDRGSVGLGPGLLGGQALAGSVVEAEEHQVGAVDLVAGGAEVLPDRADGGAAGDAVLHEGGGLGAVGVVAGAGVDAQLGLQRRADRAGFGEADQGLGEDRCLRAGGQPDGQPPGGDMIDRAAAAVCGRDRW